MAFIIYGPLRFDRGRYSWFMASSEKWHFRLKQFSMSSHYHVLFLYFYLAPRIYIRLHNWVHFAFGFPILFESAQFLIDFSLVFSLEKIAWSIVVLMINQKMDLVRTGRQRSKWRCSSGLSVSYAQAFVFIRSRLQKRARILPSTFIAPMILIKKRKYHWHIAHGGAHGIFIVLLRSLRIPWYRINM